MSLNLLCSSLGLQQAVHVTPSPRFGASHPVGHARPFEPPQNRRWTVMFNRNSLLPAGLVS